ncbi:MAG: Ig-like domain-containing protein [Gemmatimonadetes bacterium]|nr:Ig-like domain-containing protein [Gemmatimonadota bacterium]
MRTPRPLAWLVSALLVACSSDKASAPTPPPAAVASVSITGLPDSATVGDVLTLTASVRDAAGATLSGRAVTWAVSDTLTATISATGALTVVGHGPFTVTATSEGKSATATGRGILTRAANRFAYALVIGGANSATTSRVHNATGGGVRATLSGGNVIVTFERMARADSSWRETVMVTRSGSLATHCHLNGWGPAANRRDLEASVSCYATDGTKLPGTFSILVFGNGTLEGRHGFVESTDSAITHTPAGARWYNSSGQAMVVNRTGAGGYRVDVNNPRATGKVENYFVSTIGPYGTTCILSGWSFGTSSNVSCNRLGNVGADARFAKQLIEAGRPGRRWALGWNDQPSRPVDVEGAMLSTYAMSSNGQPIRIVRTTSGLATNGVYDVRFLGMGALASQSYNLQVSAYASGTVTCTPDSSAAVNGGADLEVRVLCFGRYDGAPTNAYFTILLIE